MLYCNNINVHSLKAMAHLHPTQFCHQHAIKLTPLRQQVLDILSEQKQPLTAYAVLDILKISNPKAQVMSVYRVLEFLQQHDLVHRIENLNAFMVCSHLAEHHVSQWLICKTCGSAKEYVSDHFQQVIEHIENNTGFSVSIPTIELMGTCKACQANL